MNKKTILKFNSTASIRPAAWLALAIISVGAFANSVQAQAWVAEDFSSLRAGTNLVVGGKCVAAGTAGYASGAAGGGALRFLKTTTASNTSTEARWTLSDANYTPRPSGYITFKIVQTAGASSTGILSFRLGAADNNSMFATASGWLEARFYNRSYVTSGVTTANANLMTYGGGTKVLNNSINNISNPVKIEIWYNNTNSTMSYTRPDTQATVALNTNSFVIYAGGVLVTKIATGDPFPASVTTTGTTTATTIGKISFVTGSADTSDFIVDDILVGESATSVTAGSVPTLTTNPIPVTVQAGTTVTNTVVPGGSPAPIFSTTGTWPVWATLSTNGAAVFSPSSSEAVATNSLTFTATNSVGSTNGTFNVTVTAAATVAPVITSPTNVTGKLSWPYTSSTSNNALYQITTDIAATYSLSGTLPSGLQFDPATGRIYGTPTALASSTPVSLIASAGALSSTSSVSISIVGSTWSGASANWSDTTAWTDGVVPQSSISSTNGSVAIFGATTGAGANSVVVGDKSIYGLIFNSDANAYTFSAAVDTNSFTLSNLAGIANNSTATQTFNNKVINVGGNGTWASSTTTGALVLNGGIDISGTGVPRILTLGGVGPITVASSITDGTATNACSISIANTGLTTFSGANTYAGLTTIATGANLKLGNVAALGTATGATAVSGTLDLFGFSPVAENFTVSGGWIVNSGSAASTINGTIGLTGTANSINTSNADITLSGVISGSGAFTKNGTNTLTLTGVNAFTGGFTLSNGTVIGNSDSPFGIFSTGIFINLLGGNLIVQNTNALGYGPLGAGGVRPRVNLAGGTLTAQADLTLNASGLNSGQVNIAAASTISVDSNKTVRIEKMVATDNTNAANSVLTKTGPGT